MKFCGQLKKCLTPKKEYVIINYARRCDMKKTKFFYVMFIVVLSLIININVNAKSIDSYGAQETDYNNLRIVKQGEVILIDDYDSCNVVLYEEVYSPISYYNVDESILDSKEKCEKYCKESRNNGSNRNNRKLITHCCMVKTCSSFCFVENWQ